MAPSSHARTGWTARGSPLHRAFTKERQPSGKILSTVTRVSRCVKNSAERYIGRVVFRIVASSSRARLSAHPLQFSRPRFSLSVSLCLLIYLLVIACLRRDTRVGGKNWRWNFDDMQDRSIFFGESEWNEMVEYRYRDESRCRLVTFQSGCPLVFALESGGGFHGG